MEMLRSFGTNDITIGWFHPLQKVAKCTVTLSNATVNNTEVSKEVYNLTHPDTGCGGHLGETRAKVRQVFSRIDLQMPISII